MSMAEKLPFLFAQHYIVIAMRPISFPISGKEIIEKVGSTMIPISPTEQKELKEFVEAMPLDYFTCAAEFYCNLAAS